MKKNIAVFLRFLAIILLLTTGFTLIGMVVAFFVAVVQGQAKDSIGWIVSMVCGNFLMAYLYLFYDFFKIDKKCLLKRIVFLSIFWNVGMLAGSAMCLRGGEPLRESPPIVELLIATTGIFILVSLALEKCACLLDEGKSCNGKSGEDIEE